MSLYPRLLPRATYLSKPTELLHHIFCIRPGDAFYKGFRIMDAGIGLPDMAVVDIFKLGSANDHFGSYEYTEFGRSWDSVVIQAMYWIDKCILGKGPIA